MTYPANATIERKKEDQSQQAASTNEETQLRMFREVHDLPKLELKITHESELPCDPGQDFIIVYLGDRSGNLLLSSQRGLYSPDGFLQLVGEQDENPIEVSHQLIERRMDCRALAVRPMAEVELRTHKSQKSAEGIVLVGVINPSARLTHKDISNLASDVDEILTGVNRWQTQLAQVAYSVLKEISGRLPIHEVETAVEHELGHWVNKHIVSPLAGSLASQKITQRVRSLVEGKPDSILDPSCGDDELIFALEEQFHPQYCVANDISWNHVKFLQERNPTSDVLFTNHNVFNLPFDTTFDLTVFKNTLHHIPADGHREVLQRLASLSEQLIIIDIDAPRQHSVKSRLWNEYYRRVLGDQGDDFLSFADFKRCTEQWLDRNAQFGTIQTIKGQYYYANIR